MNRLPELDGLRGVLALVVMAHHLGMFMGFEGVAPYAKYCVWAFFVMSSLVLTRAWDGRFGAFLVRRLIRLWPTYAVCLLAGYGVLGQWPRWSELLWFPWINGARAVAMTLPDPPAWSLCVEATAMLFMPAIVWFGGHKGRALLIPPVWVGLMVLDGHFFPAIFFFIGAALAPATPWLPSLLNGSVAQWLGKISYSLYLSHWVVIRACVETFGNGGVWIATALALPVAWLVWWCVERPSIQISRAVVRRRATNPALALASLPKNAA